MNEMQKYWGSIKRHPGVPIATLCMALGFIAGVKRGDTDFIFSGFVGTAVMCIFWIPVLITAWQMRNDV